MFKKFVQFTLILTTFLTTNNLPAQSLIPQMGVQETFLEGESNLVNQILNQNLALGFIYLPDLEAFLLPNFNIQGIFMTNNNNKVNQRINQIFPDFQQDNESNFNSFNQDLVLDGLQFSTQETFIEGDSNLVNQQSEQTFTDFFWLDGWENDSSFNLELEDFIEPILLDIGLDSFQVTVQDTWVYGDNNLVNQEVSQSITNLLFIDEPLNSSEFSPELINLLLNDDPFQFTIQETFLNEGENNLVNQTINQTVTDLFFIDTTLFTDNRVPYLSSNEISLENSTNFDIDEFINNILNESMINANQINRQDALVIGDENQVNQENNQELTVSVPENNSPYIILLIGIIGYKLRKKH